MKIGQPSEMSASAPSTVSGAAQKAAQNSNAVASANAGAAQSTRAVGVAVTVSTTAIALERSGRNEEAEVDTEKVAAIRAAIQDGTYTVNAEAIADELLYNAQEMLDRNQQQ
nr:flagellar biosynthesis anti-sigma factor FlgM [uncultured Rhodoferax sp.]